MEELGNVRPEDIERAEKETQDIQRMLNAIYPTPTKLVNGKCLEFMRGRTKRLEKRLTAKFAGGNAHPTLVELIRWVQKEQSRDFLEMLNWSKQILANPDYHASCTG